ncbi:MAG: aminotransferase class I/II-fold pyridoxal phosphate-dependent enzyme [Spirochaetales bacterium]|nr:MAG: aminotransferase class I/II-fold pyridoxal phosphate-dependent enzyme [Spirochaetales bacterium]
MFYIIRKEKPMNTATRFSLLGTETAFVVAEEARNYANHGLKIFPFHLGDMNLKTPENIVEAAARAIRKGKTGYCSNYGIPELREALAEDVNRSHGTRYEASNVAVEPGGKPVIQKFFLALMNPGDEVLYPSPGYPIYESVISFNGGKPLPYPLREKDGNFYLDV